MSTSAAGEVSNNLGLENMPNLRTIGLIPSTPQSHSFEDVNLNSEYGVHEVYDLGPPDPVEDGRVVEGSSTGYDLEYWEPNVPPKAADAPARPWRSQHGHSDSLRRIAHVVNFSGVASTRAYSPPPLSVSVIVKSGPVGNEHPSEPFETYDPHSSRRGRHSPSTNGLKNKLPKILGDRLPICVDLLVLVYRHLLFRLPSMYFFRVLRLFEDAEVSKPEMEQLVNGSVKRQSYAEDWSPSSNTPGLKRFKHNWEVFIDQVMQEWKTLNVVSALMLSAILTMFQINDAATQPVTRTASLFSLVCALWSLIYGCAYILRFSSLRSISRASPWAHEAQNSEAYILWNVWVVLALPAVWLAWSVIAFVTAIMAFVWTSGTSSNNSNPPPRRTEWIPRGLVTAVFALGILYFCLVIRTFSSYGNLRSARRQPQDSLEHENTRSPITAIPGRGIASPRSALDILATPEGISRYSILSSNVSPRTPDVLLTSPGLWRGEGRTIDT